MRAVYSITLAFALFSAVASAEGAGKGRCNAAYLQAVSRLVAGAPEPERAAGGILKTKKIPQAIESPAAKCKACLGIGPDAIEKGHPGCKFCVRRPSAFRELHARTAPMKEPDCFAAKGLSNMMEWIGFDGRCNEGSMVVAADGCELLEGGKNFDSSKTLDESFKIAHANKLKQGGPKQSRRRAVRDANKRWSKMPPPDPNRKKKISFGESEVGAGGGHEGPIRTAPIPTKLAGRGEHGAEYDFGPHVKNSWSGIDVQDNKLVALRGQAPRSNKP